MCETSHCGQNDLADCYCVSVAAVGYGKWASGSCVMHQRCRFELLRTASWPLHSFSCTVRTATTAQEGSPPLSTHHQRKFPAMRSGQQQWACLCTSVQLFVAGIFLLACGGSLLMLHIAPAFAPAGTRCSTHHLLGHCPDDFTMLLCVNIASYYMLS